MKSLPKVSLAVCLTLLIFSGVMIAAAEERRLPGSAGDGQDSELERAALMSIYDGMEGSYWIESEGWGGTDSYCTWYGVTCDTDKHVIVLELSGNLLGGRIPPQIEDLAALQRLELSHSGLWEPLPDELGNLAQLQVLDLSHSYYCLKWCGRSLGGPIPESLGTLFNLQVLNLSGNAFYGAIPAYLGDLAQLQTLDLSDNLYCRPSTLPPEGMNCPGGLSGTIPAALSELSALQALSLQGNRSLCWETVAARNWALALPLYSGATDCSYMPLLGGSPVAGEESNVRGR